MGPENPGKSWKSINSCNKVFFKINCLQYYFWDFYFVRVYCFNYSTFGRAGKTFLSHGKVLGN